MSKLLQVKEQEADEISDELSIYSANGLINIEDASEKHNSNSIQKLLLGVSGQEAFDQLLNQLVDSMPGTNRDYKINSLIPILLDIAPRDSLEGMLAIQMIATHNMAMEMTKQAILAEETSHGIDANLNRVNKLMRSFTIQMETLQKYRNKGQQTIRVQHVTVNDGGQAIVGNHKSGEGV